MASNFMQQVAEAIQSFNVLFGSADRDAHTDMDTDTMIPVRQNDAVSPASKDIDYSKECCVQRIGQCLAQMKDFYDSEMKRSTLLQEFLINELNHTEELGAKLRNVSEELNIVSKQRDNFKMKCESQLAELEMLTSKKVTSSAGGAGISSSSDSGTIDPQAMLLEMRLLGKFIGKTFPGYGVFYATVATYEKPYYKLVYEDGDCEDATPSEVKRLLVDKNSIAPETVEAILKKSEEFDFDNPDECFTGLIDVAPGAEEDEVKGSHGVNDIKVEDNIIENGHSNYNKKNTGSNDKKSTNNTSHGNGMAPLAPQYTNTVGSKFEDCPHCHKKIHHQGLANHIKNKCAKILSKIAPVMSAVGPKIESSTMGVGHGGNFSPGKSGNGGVFLSPRKGGATQSSPISVSSTSTNVTSSGGGSGSSNGSSVKSSPLVSPSISLPDPPLVTTSTTTPSTSTQADSGANESGGSTGTSMKRKRKSLLLDVSPNQINDTGPSSCSSTTSSGSAVSVGEGGLGDNDTCSPPVKRHHHCVA